ncbi:MAG: hypothetical protein Q9219_003089 [cf. Caloplaca sp. 3 TL-2023]
MSPNSSSPPLNNNNSLSDIFSDSPPTSPGHSTSEPSDIPRLRSTHVTNGYREGIASSKDRALQPGFDETYPLGAILGLRVGFLLGELAGLYAAYSSQRIPSSTQQEDVKVERQRVRELLVQARRELSIEVLFGRDYWGADGMWVYEVRGKEEEVTFREVVEQHPVMREWVGKVRDEVRKVEIWDAEKGFWGAGNGEEEGGEKGRLQGEKG